MLMDVVSQADTAHTLSKYLNIAWLWLVYPPHVGSQVVIKPDYKQRYWLYHCGVSDNSRRNGIAFVKSEKAQSALIEWMLNDLMAHAIISKESSSIFRSFRLSVHMFQFYVQMTVIRKSSSGASTINNTSTER